MTTEGNSQKKNIQIHLGNLTGLHLFFPLKFVTMLIKKIKVNWNKWRKQVNVLFHSRWNWGASWLIKDRWMLSAEKSLDVQRYTFLVILKSTSVMIINSELWRNLENEKPPSERGDYWKWCIKEGGEKMEGESEGVEKGRVMRGLWSLTAAWRCRRCRTHPWRPEVTSVCLQASNPVEGKELDMANLCRM